CLRSLDGVRRPADSLLAEGRDRSTRLSFFVAALAAAPLRVAPRELVEVRRNLDQRAGYLAHAAVVLALICVDVPLTLAREADQGLIGLALAAFHGQVSNVDHAEGPPSDLLVSFIYAGMGG